MRIALAYSGSLEDSAAIAWLRKERGAEVVAVTVDLGQGRELEAVRDRALGLGAHRAHVLDAREPFAQRFVLAALSADALHEGRAPMGLALSRPAIAEKLLEIARIERADAVAHAGGEGARLDRLLRDLSPAVDVISTVASWQLTSDALAAFADAHGLRASAGSSQATVESTLWGRSMKRRPTVDAGVVAAFFSTSRSAGHYPDEPATVEIAFERGVPTALNGVALPLLELIASVGTLAATHGVGRVELDDLLCDAPAAVLLHTAHRELARAAMTPDGGPMAAAVSAAYESVLDEGRWFSTLRDALDAFLAVTERRVTGHVRLRLLKGVHTTVAIELAEPSGSLSAATAFSSTQN